mgnify:CR=1 FL=1
MSLTLARVEFFDTHLTRRIEWNSPELGISLHNSELTYFESEFHTDADDDDDDDAAGDDSPIWPDPYPIAHRDEISRSGIPHFDYIYIYIYIRFLHFFIF